MTACRLRSLEDEPDVLVTGPPEKVVEKVEVMEALAYHALWS